jgi:hypothetical protein
MNYDAISRLGVTPDIDLFASRIKITKLIEPYVDLHPDPGAIAVKCFPYVMEELSTLYISTVLSHF